MTAPRESGTPRIAQQIIDRAGSDAAFRSKLTRDPRDAIQSEFGIAVPEGVTVRVLEEQPGEVILVLPGRAVQSGTSLSDEDLEKAAGGALENTYSIGNVGPCVC